MRHPKTTHVTHRFLVDFIDYLEKHQKHDGIDKGIFDTCKNNLNSLSEKHDRITLDAFVNQVAPGLSDEDKEQLKNGLTPILQKYQTLKRREMIGDAVFLVAAGILLAGLFLGTGLLGAAAVIGILGTTLAATELALNLTVYSLLTYFIGTAVGSFGYNIEKDVSPSEGSSNKVMQEAKNVLFFRSQAQGNQRSEDTHKLEKHVGCAEFSEAQL